MPRKLKMPEIFPFCSSGSIEKSDGGGCEEGQSHCWGQEGENSHAPLRKCGDGITRALSPELGPWAQLTGKKEPQGVGPSGS